MAKKKKGHKYSVYYASNGRGMPKVQHTVLGFLSAFPKMNMFCEHNSDKETKALPLQTETKLMLDTVLKDPQVGMSLKISKRKQDVLTV